MPRFAKLLLVLLAAAGNFQSASAQQRASVGGVVRNERGEPVGNTRVRATAPGTDTTVRTNDRGVYLLLLPMGSASLTVTSVGYESQQRTVVIDSATVKSDFVVRAIARQLSQFDVRENWIGIRGGIGDDSTRQPIRGAFVTAARQKIRIETDSNGRFEIPLESDGNAVLRIERPGYQTKIVGIDVNKKGATDVVLFLKPGSDVRGAQVAYADLGHRTAATMSRSFMVGRNKLVENGATTLYDAIIAAGLLGRNGLRFLADGEFCFFVDGQQRMNQPLSAVRMDDVELVEVYGYGSDVTRSLRPDRPPMDPCYKDPQFRKLKSFELKLYVQLVSVWTRKHN